MKTDVGGGVGEAVVHRQRDVESTGRHFSVQEYLGARELSSSIERGAVPAARRCGMPVHVNESSL